MIVCIQQPAYLPWLGYFDRIRMADVHVVLDDVQFEKGGLINRNRVRSPDGGETWLTVPVRSSGGRRICDLEIDNGRRWGIKHWRTLAQVYGRAPYFDRYASFWEATLSRPWEDLTWLLDFTLGWFAVQLGLATRTVKSSWLDVSGHKSDLVLGICQAVGADTYLSGPMGRDYLDRDAFARAGIGVQFHVWEPPRYRQPQGEFLPNLSALDALLNVGPDAAKLIGN